MNRIWLSVCIFVLAAAGLAIPSVASDGKGGGKGGGKGNGSNKAKSGDSVAPTGPGKSEPAREFDHPRSGNSLPQEVRDRLPHGLRDKPVLHPGVANHLGKMGYTIGEDGSLVPPPAKTVSALPQEFKRLPVGPTSEGVNSLPQEVRDRLPAAAPANVASAVPQEVRERLPSVAPANTVHSLPPEVRDRLPPGLRDRPVTHPGVANHLGRMGWTVGEDGTLVPPPARTVTTLPQEVRDRLPPGLRDRPITHPGVANHLGKMGWTVGEDGTLVPPPVQTVNSLPPEVRDRIPLELRDQPLDNPRVANYLGKLGWTVGEDGFAAPPSPGLFPEFRPFGGLFRPR